MCVQVRTGVKAFLLYSFKKIPDLSLDVNFTTTWWTLGTLVSSQPGFRAMESQ